MLALWPDSGRKGLAMLKMLIAVDGSAHAQRAIEAVARLQQKTAELKVLLVNVRDVPLYSEQYTAREAQAAESMLQQEQSRLLDAALAAARQAGLKQVSTAAEVGLAAQEITRVATEMGADVIAMGTHGRSVLGGLFLGSVAQRVVHLATMPVLLVK